MTSKHLFFRILREDLRHKVWMIALSLLGNFLVLPVSWLILRGHMERFDPHGIYLAQIYGFFGEYMIIGCGIVAIVIAFITGLFGFRFLFHRKMVDTWHSLPVKRSTQFGACYLGGILIGFLPMVLCMAITIALAGGFLYSLGGSKAFGIVFKDMLICLVILAVVYLLVYHVALVSVMFCGNVLNALVCFVILGYGAVSVYGITTILFAYNLQTFLQPENVKTIMYASPLLSAIFLLSVAPDMSGGEWNMWGYSYLLLNMVIAAALGLWAVWLYRRRASEMAEQGIRSKTAGTLLRVMAGVIAGMCGWQLFVMMVSNSRASGWGSFGGILACVMTFGVLDIIIHMEFKAFFAHKLQMGLTTALALLICFSLYGDWFGYDTYLPRKDAISGIAVFDMNFSNRYQYNEGKDALESINYKDVEKLYAYLQAVVEGERLSEEGYYGRYGYESYDIVNTKVTLKSGRSYYRRYHLMEEDKELLWELLSSEEYLRYAYCIDEEAAARCSYLSLSRRERSTKLESVPADTIRGIIRAYNQDVLETPECVLRGSGRLLVRLELFFVEESGRFLDIYEGMEHTVAALEAAGLQEWGKILSASEVEEISLSLGVYVNDAMGVEDIVDKARERYWLYREWEDEEIPEFGEEQEEEPVVELAETFSVDGYGNEWEPVVVITDQAEIEELLEMISYMAPFRGGNVFQAEYVSVTLTDVSGAGGTAYIPKGALPEKYILRFGELR